MYGDSSTARQARPDAAEASVSSEQYYLQCQCHRAFALLRFSDVIGFERTFRTPPGSGSHGYRAWAGHLVPTVDLTSLAGGHTGDEGFLVVCAVGDLDHPGVAGFIVDRAHEPRFFSSTGPLIAGMPLTVPPEGHALSPDQRMLPFQHPRQFLDMAISLTFKANRREPLTYFNTHWPGMSNAGESADGQKAAGAEPADEIREDVVDALTDVAEPIDVFNDVVRSPALHEDMLAWKVFDMVVNAYASDRVLELIAKRIKQDRDFIRVPVPVLLAGLRELRNELWHS